MSPRALCPSTEGSGTAEALGEPDVVWRPPGLLWRAEQASALPFRSPHHERTSAGTKRATPKGRNFPGGRPVGRAGQSSAGCPRASFGAWGRTGRGRTVLITRQLLSPARLDAVTSPSCRWQPRLSLLLPSRCSSSSSSSFSFF